MADELVVHGIRKRFGAVDVLRGVDLTVTHGEFVTLLGPSGCGKSTLVRIIAGLEVADQGTVHLRGRDLGALPANRRPVNTVFQHYALFPHLDVAGNVAFGLRARRQPETEVRRRVAAALAMLRIADLGHRRIDQLSGGQRQRVALARALVNEPELLLLDEPMSALDAQLRAEVQMELRRLHRQLGTTFILVTHDQDEAMTVSDRIIVMDHGSIAQIGDPAEIYERPADRFVASFLGAANLIPATRVDGASAIDTAIGRLALRQPAPWMRGTIAIRPERIAVTGAAPAVNGVRATVREAVYRGDHVDLFVEPGGLRVRTPPGPRLAPGDEVWLELPAPHLHPLRD